MEKGPKKFEVMWSFLLLFYSSFMLLSEGFGYSIDLNLEQRIDGFQPFFTVVWFLNTESFCLHAKPN